MEIFFKFFFLAIESEAVSAVPAVNVPTVSTNQSSAEQATGSSLPSSETTEQNSRFKLN